MILLSSYNVGTIVETPHGVIFSPIYRTPSKEAFDRVMAGLAPLIKSAPKMRSPTGGNSRPVKVVDLNLAKLDRMISRRRLIRSFHVGTVWPSAASAGLALGLGATSISQLFHRARKANGDVPCSIWVRGHELEYADIRDKVRI